MVDISDPKWSEVDSNNNGVAPDGIQGGYPPNTVAPILRATRGAVKRAYNKINAIYTTTGTATALVLTLAATPDALVKGERYAFFASQTNTGAMTLNVNGLGAKSILQQDGAALAAGQIVSGSAVAVIYDGTNFRLENYISNPKFTGTVSAGTVSATTVTATNITATHSGNGAALTDLNASNISTGTIADARLPSTLTSKTFSGPITSNGAVLINTAFPEVRLTRTADNAWRNVVDANDGSFVVQHSTDAFAANFTNSLVLTKAGEAFVNGSKVYTQGNLSPALTVTQMIAGNGLTGGGSLSTNRTFTLGTPTAISGSSTNSVTTSSHTHQLLLTAADISGALGYLPGKGDGVPIGGMIMLYGNDSSAPVGYLLANGAAVTATYPDLRAFGLARGWAVNASGDPMLPDMGGYFVRGWRTGQTVDSARAFGTVQQDAFQNHRHPANRVTNATISVPVNNNQYGPSPYIAEGYQNVSWGTANGHGADLPDGANGTPRTANETRPANVTVTYWIKAFSSDQTTGSADLTQLGNDVSSLTIRTSALEAKGPFSSAAQTVIGSGVVTVAHTLGKVPAFITLDFVNTQAEGGYSVGDIVNVAPSLPDNYGGHGITVCKTATNVIVIFSSGGVYLNQKTGGAPYLMNPTRWQVIVRAAA